MPSLILKAMSSVKKRGKKDSKHYTNIGLKYAKVWLVYELTFIPRLASIQNQDAGEKLIR